MGEVGPAASTDTSEQPDRTDRTSAGRLKEFGFWPLTVTHLVQVAVAAAAILATARMTAISYGSPQLAGAILAATGYIGPLANLLFTMVPLGLLLLGMSVWEYRQVARRAEVTNWITRWSFVILIDIVIVLAFIGPWVMPVGLLTYVVVMGTLDWTLFGKHWRDPSPTPRAPVRRTIEVAWTVVFMVALITMSSRAPWMQKEVVTTEATTTTGYVLSVDDRWTTVLVDTPRYLEYLPSDSVTSRTACDTKAMRTLVEVIGRMDVDQPPGCEAVDKGDDGSAKPSEQSKSAPTTEAADDSTLEGEAESAAVLLP